MGITNAQIAAIDKQRMELIFDDVNLGAVKPDTLRVQVSGNYQPVTIDQLYPQIILLAMLVLALFY